VKLYTDKDGVIVALAPRRLAYKLKQGFEEHDFPGPLPDMMERPREWVLKSGKIERNPVVEVEEKSRLALLEERIAALERALGRRVTG